MMIAACAAMQLQLEDEVSRSVRALVQPQLQQQQQQPAADTTPRATKDKIVVHVPIQSTQDRTATTTMRAAGSAGSSRAVTAVDAGFALF